MKAIFLILGFLFSLNSALAEMKGQFIFSSEVSSLKEGDIVEAVLKVWPLENADAAEFSKLQNLKIFSVLQLVQIQSIAPSVNNADVIEMKGTYIVHAAKALTPFEFNHKGQVVQVDAPFVKIIPLENKAGDYFIVEQSLNTSRHLFYLFGSIVLLLLLIAFVKRRKLMALLERFRLDPRAQLIRYFDDKFQQAATRKDYEEIYAKKEEWLPLLKERSLVYDEFLNVMNRHQYKPAWGTEELREIKSFFDNIRGSFK